MRKGYVNSLQWGFSLILLTISAASFDVGINRAGSVVGLLCSIGLLPVVWPRLRLSPWVGVLAALLGITAWRTTLPEQAPASPFVTDAPLSAKQVAENDSITAANERAAKLDSDINTAHIRAATAIRHTLKDPDSFEEIDHRSGYAGEIGAYVSCQITYRAKNSFGGYAVEAARVDFDETMQAIAVTPAVPD